MSTKITKPYPIYINESKGIKRLSIGPVGTNGYVGDGLWLFGSPQGSLDQTWLKESGISMMRLPGGSNSDSYIWNSTGYSNADSGGATPDYGQGLPVGTNCAFPSGRVNSPTYPGSISGITTPQQYTDYKLIASTLKAANPNANFNVTVNYGSGPGISTTTTTTAAITATGSQSIGITAVTDGSLGAGGNGRNFAVTIDTGTNAELVQVTAITGSTFNVTAITGNFTKTHVSGVTVQWYAPQAGQPSLAASWVTDANSTNNFAVKYWCIGNEVYGGWENNLWPSVAQSTTAVTAGASVAVTFANGQSVNDGSLFAGQNVLVVDYVNGNETVSVTASTATSLTATFAKAHSGTYQLQWGYPSMAHSQTVRDGQQYGQAVKTYISDMKNSDPAIKVGVCIDNGQIYGDGSWASPSGSHGMSPYNPANDPFNNGLFGELTTTTPTFTGIGPSANVTLGGPAVQPDFVEFHWYPFGGDSTNRTVNEESLLTISNSIPDIVTSIESLLQHYYPNTWQNTEIIIGETSISAPTPNINWLTTSGAIFLAQSYAQWLSNGITSVQNWLLRGLGPAKRNDTNWDMYGIHPTLANPVFGDYDLRTSNSSYNSGGANTTSTANVPGTAGSGQDIPFPTYYALQCLGMVFTPGATVIQCTSPSIDVETYATKQADGSVGVLIINKSKTASYTISPAVQNGESLFGTAKAVSISGEDQTDFSVSPPSPPTPTITSLPVEDNTVSFTVKPYSVSAIQLVVGSKQLTIEGTTYPKITKAMPTVLIMNSMPYNATHLQEMVNNGFTGAMLSLSWGSALTNITAVPTVGGSYQSSYYTWNESYFQQVQNSIKMAKEAGLTVHLDPGLQYPPDSGAQTLTSLLYGQSSNVRLMSNNGVAWWAGGFNQNPPGVWGGDFGGFNNGGLECVNTVFDPISRIAARDYIHKLFSEIDPEDITSVRWGAGMVTGEVQYPRSDNANIGNPGNAPTLTASTPATATGLVAGAYIVGYTWVNTFGQTMASPNSMSITITAGQQINATSAGLPNNATAVNWYVSTAAGGTVLGYSQQTTGNTATITAVGNATAVPTANTTGNTAIMWCYDALAQSTTNGNSFTDPSLQPYTNIPSAVVGLKPNTAGITSANAYTLLQWYVEALANTVVWGINTISAAGFSGEIEVLIPAWGARVHQVNNIWQYGTGNDDLYSQCYPGSGYPINNPGDLTLGVYPDILIEYISRTKANVSIHCTWADAAANPTGNTSNLSPFHYQAQLARRYGLPMVGENTGKTPPLSHSVAASYYTLDSTVGMEPVTGDGTTNPTAPSLGLYPSSTSIGMYYNASRYALRNCRRIYIAFESSILDWDTSNTFGTAPLATTALNATDTTSTVNYGAVSGVIPGFGVYYIQIDSEMMLVTGFPAASQLTVTRGMMGTVKAAHAIGATITAYQGVPLSYVGQAARKFSF